MDRRGCDVADVELDRSQDVESDSEELSRPPLAVVGAGGLGRETVVWARRAGFDVVGFLDRDITRHGEVVSGVPILGNIEWLDSDDAGRFGDRLVCVVAVGAPAGRRSLSSALAAAGHPMATVIDSSAVIGPNVAIGVGTIVCARVTITMDAHIGHNVVLSVGSNVHHDDVVGDHAFIGPGAQLSGNVTIGPGAWIGIGASIVQGVTVGAGSVVGAGAVVVDDLPDDVTAVGVPARVISQHELSW